MGVVKRENEYLGLKNLDILVEDTQADSKYFRILECPSIITQGKSSFLIGGSPQGYLKAKTEVKFELVHDLTGEVIYTEAVRDHWEGGLRRVSIEVYENIEPGPATLYVLGELDPDTSDVEIPTEWQNIYNVRWQKSLTINSAAVNTQPILFYKQPRITVGETFRGHINVTTGSSYTTYLTGSGEPRQELNPIVPVVNTSAGGLQTPATYPQLDFANKSKLSIIEENKALNKLTGRRGHIGSIGNLLQTNSPAPSDYVISVDSTSKIDSLYVGHTITINDPQVDTSKFITESYHSITTPYTSSVMKVLNETTFVPKDVFYVNDTRTTPSTFVPAPLASQYVTASYQDLPVQAISYINYFSFADIQLSDLRTFSGDVHKIKVYVKSDGSLGDFEKIYDSPIESSEVLFDNNESTLLGNMGYFIGSARLQQYWELYQGKDGNGGSTTITYDSSYIQNAMKVSGDNEEYEDTLRVDLTQDVNFIAGNLYTVRANLYGKKLGKKDSNGNLLNKGEFKVYVKGDAFNKSSIEASHWGSQKFKVPDFPAGVTEYNFGVISGDFIADNTGTGKLQFKVPSGEWYVSDISVKASTDTAFNPDYVRVTAPVPQLRTRPDSLRFLVEFYDVNNNIADSIIFSDSKSFTGENTSIGGTDNILSGSMVIGSALGSGIELAGVGSGFIRSIGYSGFTSASAGTGGPGFMIYSGSVLSHRTDEYNGVGLDLVAHSGSYLRYRTEPIAELDIRADSFFVGNPDSQFISGSGDKIEISSSNFHVSASGDVNMSGTITATAGNIGDWTISGGDIVGANITMDADSSRIYKTDDNNEHDGYYMDFTPGSNYYIRMGSHFAVSSSGQLFASGAKIEGVLTASEGYIANWTIAQNSINKFSESTYTGMSSVGDTRFFAGAASLAASGSAVFNVKSTGDITGSQVLFTGGKVGGFDITSTTISSGTDILLDAGNKRLSLADGSIFLDGDLSDGTFYVGRSVGANLSSPDGYGARFKGNGNFVIVSGSGEYIRSLGNGLEIVSKNVNISGSQVTILTPKMFLGATGSAFISASNGEMEISSSNFFVKSDGSINAGAGDFTIDTSGNVVMTGTITAEAGTIGGWDITSSRMNSPDSTMRFTSSNPKITIGTHTIGDGPGIQLGYDGSDVLTFFAGQNNGGVTDYIRYVHGSGVDIKTAVFNLDTTNLDISSTAKRITINDGSNDRIWFGEVDGGTTYGMKIFDGTGTADGDILVEVGEGGNTIAGFTIATTGITSTGIGVHPTGQTYAFTAGTSNEFNVKHSGQVTASAALISGSDVDIQVSQFELSTDGVDISSTNQSLIVGSNDLSLSAGTGAFISGSGEFRLGDDDGNISFVDDSFTLAGADVNIRVTQLNISSSGFTLSSPHASMSLGNNDEISFHARNSSSGSIPIFKLSGGEISASNFFVDVGGNLTASNAIFTGNITADEGYIGGSTGWTIATGKMTSTGIGVATSAGDGTYAFWAGNDTPASAEYSVTHAGAIKATSGTIGGFTLSATALTGGSTTTTVALTPGTGIHMGHASFASAPFSVTNAGYLKASSGNIGGWEVGTEELTGGQMIIRKDGTIESAGFASNVAGSGFRLTAASGGFLEVENARIRGTLSTAVFEKETVNAVGGQLYVANSTTLTSSIDNPAGFYAAADTTMSVANVTGFIEGEILSAKKVSPTGFGTEYLLVESASRNNSSSDTDYSGQIYVARGYGESWVGDSGSLGESPGGAQTYSGSQVIVSTGKVGTGFIRLNANPNDPYTPYIDIVERTGSNIYDVDLKARLGDLSGLSSARLHGTDPAGQFGLYSKNVYLEGAIVANTGSIAGIEMNDGRLFTGTGTHDNSNTGFYLDSSSNFSLGDKLVWDGSNLSVAGSITITGGSGFATQADVNTAATNAVTSGSNAASSAETTAISAGQASAVATQASASADATTKSNAAQSAAESTAASDATSKANAAQSAASASAAVGTAIAQTQANTGVANAASAQSTANTAETNAQTGITNAAAAQSTANTGVTNAATAQSAAVAAQGAIDTMETQLVLDSGGMGLWSSGGTASGFLVADYGTTTKFYDGVDDLAANVKLQLNASGINLYGADLSDNLTITSGDISMYTNSVRGVHIVDGKMSLGPGANANATLGAVIANIHLASTGAYIYGAATDDYVHVKSDGVDVVAANVTQASFGATTVIGTVDDKVTLSSSGITITEGGNDNITLASGNATLTGGSVTLRSSVNNNDKFVLTADSAKLYDNNTEVASFGATTTIGTTGTTGAYSEISSGTFKVKNNATDFLTASSTGLSMVGSITATTGEIGGWTIANNALSSSATSDGQIILDGDNRKLSFATGSNGNHAFGAAGGIQIAVGGAGDGFGFGPRLHVGDIDSSYIRYTFGNLQISSSNFYLASNGNVTMAGTVTATAGSIGGWSINSTSMYTGTEDHSGYTANDGDMTFYSDGSNSSIHAKNFYITTAGDLVARDVTLTGQITATTGAIGGWSINGTSMYTGTEDHSGYTANAGDMTFYSDGADSSIHAKNFYITTAGDLVATNVDLTGAITATSGTIGGWTAAGTLSATNIVLNPAGPSIYLNGKSSFGANVDGVWIGTDGISIGDADEFNVTNAGVLTATSATITGAITATSGTFSGTINASGGTFTGAVSAGGAKFGLNVASTNDGLYLDSNNHWYDSGVLTTNSITATGGTVGGWTIGSSLYNGRSALTTGTGIYIGTDGIAIGSNAGTPQFKILSSGALTATSATITGVITATSGAIGSWTLANALYSGRSALTTGTGIYIGTDGIAIGSNAGTPQFKILSSGALTATSATITGVITATSGAIGSWTLANALYSGRSALTTGTGIYIGTDGIAIGSNAGTPQFKILSSGALTATSATITGAITATSGTFSGTVNASGGNFTGNVTAGSVTIGTGGITGTGYTINASGIQLSGASTIDINSVFTVSSAGAVMASSGTIGGFHLAAAYLVNQTGTTANATSGFIKSTTADDVVIFAGADNVAASDANFSVTNAGAVVASNLTLTGGSLDLNSVFAVSSTGVIASTSGAVGGWTLSTKTFTSKAHANISNQIQLVSPQGGSTDTSRLVFLGEDSAGSGTYTARSKIYDTTTTMDASSISGLFIQTEAGQSINLKVGGAAAAGANYINTEGKVYQYYPYTAYTFGTSPHAKGGRTNTPMAQVSSNYGGTRGSTITTHDLAAPLNFLKTEGSPGSTSTPFFGDDQVNASSVAYNSRGAGDGLLVGAYAFVNDKCNSIAGLFDGSVRNYDMQSSAWSLIARRRPFCVGNPFVLGANSNYTDGRMYGRHITGTHGSRWGQGDDMPADHVCTLIAYPFDAGSDDPSGTEAQSSYKSSDHGGKLAFGYDDGTTGNDATPADQFRGRVAIGRWEPEYKLDVNGDIRAAGNVIAYSDRRHKNNIETIKNPIEIVKGMRGVYFNWKDKYADWVGMTTENARRKHTGVIAQEIEKVLPEVVFEDTGGGPDGEGFKNVDYGKLTGVLIEAIKEQQVQIEDLQKEVIKLKENK